MASVSSRASSPAFIMSMSDVDAGSTATPASSPPPPSSDAFDLDDVDDNAEDEEDEEIDEETEERLRKLDTVLAKSAVAVQMLKEQMDRVRLNLTRRTNSSSEDATKASSNPATKKRTQVDDPDSEQRTSKRLKTDGNTEEAEGSAEQPFEQSAMVSGTTLKDYQLEGVAWMAGLHRAGMSGILADEMGLGKTLQTIAFHAYLRERSALPFLVLCPLSVLNNWVEEFAKFAPDIPVVMYHGTPDERAEIRRTQMALSEDDAQAQAKRLGYSLKSSATNARTTKGKSKTSKGKVAKNAKTVADSYRPRVTKNTPLAPNQRTNFPVVITTYEMLMKDRAYLAAYYWGFIVVDEGHRLKNMNCRLIQELRMVPTGSRMILTGTPLQNNLSELFTLLNFVLPDLFTDPVSFEEWFDMPRLQKAMSSKRSTEIIHKLHALLKPVLLRRLKTDVETTLPPKKEYVLYAPLSERQRELYDAIASGGLRALLMKEAGQKQGRKDESDEEEDVPLQTQSKGKGKGLRRTKRKNYAVDGNDDEYFRRLEAGEIEDLRRKGQDQSTEELAREWHRKSLLSKVNRMSLQNMVMQLRKVCSHPFLFDWPIDPKTRQPVLDDELSTASGKMMVLERLLDELFERGHKVLLFSQFTTMLDIIEDWATEFKGWPVCRIDGSTPIANRRAAVNSFQNGGKHAPSLFLLSTRAGGQGLNLVAADTVIFYDQDWNPQMDLQAQDRAHRIGQTRPVLVFRIVSKHTVETKIMQRATDKRKLEALVIAKGEFRNPSLAQTRSKKDTLAQMAADLLKLEGEQIEVVPSTAVGKASVISDAELDILLDRSPEVFTQRGKGWTSAGSAGEGSSKDKENGGRSAAFAVYNGPATQGNDLLEMLSKEEQEDE